MNNEPVAWQYQWEGHTCWTKMPHEGCIPLYTHPAQELNDGGEPVKNATYWKRQYNEMSALNDRLKSSLYHANEQIKYLEFHPADLTYEEIMESLAELEHEQWMTWAKNLKDTEALSIQRLNRWLHCFKPYSELSEEMKEHDREWARKALAILRKANEK